MKDLTSAIQYLYEQWILRDLLSYITPGAFLVAAISIQLIGLSFFLDLIKSLPLVIILFLFGPFFIIGFALQNLGEKLGLIVWHARKDDVTHLSTLQKFHAAAASEADDWIERTRERISVKKNMTGTALVALIFAGLFTLVVQGVRLLPFLEIIDIWVSRGMTILILGFLGWGMYIGHHHQLNNQTIWEDIALKEMDREQVKTKSDEQHVAN